MFDKSGINVEFNHTLLYLLRCWEVKDDQVHLWMRLLTSGLHYLQTVDRSECLSCPVRCHGLFLQREGILLYIMARKVMDSNLVIVETPLCVVLCSCYGGSRNVCELGK